jgi:hypothetical protein
MKRNAKLVKKLIFISKESLFFSFLIDLQGLYAKGIEASNFNKLALNNLRQK